MAPGLLNWSLAAAATSTAPFADEATDTQFDRGAVVGCQLAPESVEVYSEPGFPTRSPELAATSLLPSADAAMDVQKFVLGDRLGIQVPPELVEA